MSVVLARLWRLEIDIPFLSFLGHGHLISSNTHLPLLKCLTISLRNSELEAVLKHAPLLTELSWSRHLEVVRDLDFRWFASSTLTKLELDWAGSAAQFIGILENFPSLSDLTYCTNQQPFIARSPLVFPNLRSLTLNHTFVYIKLGAFVLPIRLLDLVTLPQLVRLQCSSPLLRDVLKPFISRSACVVRELKCHIYEDDENLLKPDPVESDIWN